MSVGDKVRFVLRGIGQTLITAGLVVLLFVVYEVWVTNIFAHEKQVKVHNALEKEWATGKNPLAPLPNGAIASIPLGTGIANLYMPRLGPDFHFTIVEGDTIPTDGQLEQGPVHYGSTALPGQIGNFSVAGHRVGKGEPFLNLDHLRSGDAVIVETESLWYVYRVLGTPVGSNPQSAAKVRYPGAPDAIPGREVVLPNGLSADGQDVLNPVPDNPAGTKATVALMTMTTCTPKFTASHRMIVHAQLAQTINKQSLGNGRYDNTMPAQLKALYSGGKD
jgi:sortase A